MKQILNVYTVRRKLLLVSFVVCCCFPPLAYSYESGLELATAVYDRPDGDDMFSTGVMALVEKGHKPRVRQMVSFRQDKANGDIVSMIRFKKPIDIKNTGLLTVDYKEDKDTDQWIYLPAVDKSRRVSSKRKGGRFVGSDIFYEDLRDRKVSADSHRILRKEKLNGMDTIVLESIPVVASNSVYDKRLSWIHEKTLLAVRLDLFKDGGKKPIKRVLIKKIASKQGIWTAMTSVVKDLNTGHETHMKINKILYNQNLPADIFTQKFLNDPQRENRIIEKISGN